MLPILDYVAGSVSGSTHSGLGSSGMAGMLALDSTGEGMGDDISGEGKDTSRHIPLACMLLIHSLYIVDDIFELINIMYSNYFLLKI